MNPLKKNPYVNEEFDNPLVLLLLYHIDHRLFNSIFIIFSQSKKSVLLIITSISYNYDCIFEESVIEFKE